MASLKCRTCGNQLSLGKAGEPCPKCGSRSKNLTSEERAVLRDKAKVARHLAQKHFEIEPGLMQVFTIWDKRSDCEAQPNTPIKLLEVNKNAFPSGVILPLGFDPVPSAGITYSSVIINVTPDEFSKIQSKELKLPPGWVLGEALPKSS